MPAISVLNMFASSPVRPLQKHMGEALRATELVYEFFVALVDQDWKKAKTIQKNISDAEHVADQLKRELRKHLPKGLFMSIPRSDVLALLKAQEKLVNHAKDVSGLALGRKIQIPSSMVEAFLVYCKTAAEVAKEAHNAISEVDELMEIGFRGCEADHIEKIVSKLDDIESETDHQQVGLRMALFALESELPPVDVMFLYRIIEKVGDLANDAQEVGGKVVLLLAE